MGILKNAPRGIWSFLNLINRLVKKDNNRILLYSNLGFRDNVKAFYNWLIQNEYNKKYRIICSCKDFKQYSSPPENVKFIPPLPGLFQFFRSRFCFYCFGKYPVKPAENQTVINLWHGMPLKRIGNMESGKENIDQNYFTYLLCTSEFFRPVMKQSFNASDRQIFICGQPRTDVMINTPFKDAKNSVMSKIFHEKDNEDSQILLWLPTFRPDSSTEIQLLSDKTLKELSRLCRQHNWRVLVKLHPLSSADTVRYGKYDFIEILNQTDFEKTDTDLYTVLKASGCLITDYSSVYFDYMLLDRPIGFTVYDMDSYENSRGFVFENPYDYMPGCIIKNPSELTAFAEEVFSGEDSFKEKRRQLCSVINSFSDGENCRRAAEKAGITK